MTVTRPDARDRHGPPPLPAALRTLAAWSARLLLIGAAVYVLARLATALGPVVLSLFGGLLLTALLRPAAARLERCGLPRLVASWLTLLATLAVLAGVGWFLVRRVSGEITVLQRNLAGGLERARDLLVEVGIPRDRLDQLTSDLVGQVLGSGRPALLQGATWATTAVGAVALALFTAFWLTYDGARMARGVIGLLPARVEPAATRAGRCAWQTLGSYLRGITVVALIDGIGIGIALVLIGVPLPLTLAVLTFLGAYVPLIGAAVAGCAAVLVALAAQGTTAALLTLGAVIAIQQIEGQLLYPLVMGRALPLHPLSIAYALAAGALLYGISGAVLAVPVVAAVHAVAAALSRPAGALPDDDPPDTPVPIGPRTRWEDGRGPAPRPSA